MLTNIIDRRKRPYRFKKINAVIEATWHDNSYKDADRAKRGTKGSDGPDYDELEHCSVSDAIIRANAYKNSTTLYLYDHDAGIYEVKASRRKKRIRHKVPKPDYDEFFDI